MSKRLIVISMASMLTASLAMAENPAPKPKSEAKTEAATTAAPSAEKAPRLTIVEPVKDYGTVPKGDKLDWAFVIKNTGDADLQIISAKPGCGCTVADFDKVIKPGQTGKVTAHVDTTAFAGPIAKSVTLETNDPASLTAQLTIHAVVKPYVEAFPAGFVRYNLLQGDASSESVTLYSEEEEPFQITSIETPADWIKAEYKKVDDPSQIVPNGKPGQNQYKLNITVGGPDAKLGPIADKIHVVTNSKHQPDYYISVTGVVRPSFRVDPTGINFGEVAPADAAAMRTVLIHSNDLKSPDHFVVMKAVSAVPGVTAAVAPGANKGDYVVTLQVTKDAKDGNLDGAVKIFTNDKLNPVVTVPVKGTIKSVASAPAKSSK
jgi:archaellum component FlaG (FlaF/FlaG flagellin family)